jgi:hypothetical protein
MGKKIRSLKAPIPNPRPPKMPKLETDKETPTKGAIK